MKKLFILIILVSILIVCSCNKKKEKKDFFKKIDYNISQILYKKDYENAIKYIDSVYFNKENLLTDKNKSYLSFKEAEIKYLYLNNSIDAYKEMKKLFKKNKLDKKNYIKLLKYLIEISEVSDYQNFGVFLERLVEIDLNKETLYKYINFLKKEKKIKKLENIVKNNNVLSKDELILLKLDVLILKKEKKETVLKYIDKYIKICKNQETADTLKVEKIFYLEQEEKVDYADLLNILKTIKTKKYKNLVKNKKIFYNKKILLYNKK